MRKTKLIAKCCKAVTDRIGFDSVDKYISDAVIIDECNRSGISFDRIKLILNR